MIKVQVDSKFHRELIDMIDSIASRDKYRRRPSIAVICRLMLKHENFEKIKTEISEFNYKDLNGVKREMKND